MEAFGRKGRKEKNLFKGEKGKRNWKTLKGKINRFISYY